MATKSQLKTAGRRNNGLKLIEELKKQVGNRTDIDVCSNYRCSIKKVQSIDQFKGFKGKKINNCLTCRKKNQKADQARNERNKNNGKAKQKEQRRTEIHRDTIIRLRKENKDPNIFVCGDRDCKDRYRPKEEFDELDINILGRCKACRKSNRAYDIKSKAKIRSDPEQWDKVLKQQRDWRINNPDKNDENNRRRRINAKNKVNTIIKHAIERKYEFNLDLDFAMTLCTDICYYCDNPPTDEQINGIDRIDNSKGYLIDNVVSCCTVCNISKGTATIDNFIKRCIHIISYHKINNKYYKLYPDIFFNDDFKNKISKPKKLSYNVYRKNAKEQRKINFELSNMEYKQLNEGICFYCGQSNFKYYNKIGIDRKNSDKGYTLDNCVSCCSCCNYLKNEISFELFFKHIEKIVNKHKDEYI